MLTINTSSTFDMLLGNKNDALKIRHRIEEMIRKSPQTFNKVARLLMTDGDIRWEDLGQETIESSKVKSAEIVFPGLFTKEQGEKIFGNKPLVLEHEKCYLNRKGDQIFVIYKYPDSAFPFEDTNIGDRFASNGKSEDLGESEFDLVKEA